MIIKNSLHRVSLGMICTLEITESQAGPMEKPQRDVVRSIPLSLSIDFTTTNP